MNVAFNANLDRLAVKLKALRQMMMLPIITTIGCCVLLAVQRLAC